MNKCRPRSKPYVANCEKCGKGFRRQHHNTRPLQRFCSGRCAKFVTGRKVMKTGYVMIRVYDRPDAGNGGYVYEHRYVVEKAMGKPLRPGAEIHHVNEDKTDNRPQNLVVCPDKSYHVLLHIRQRVIRAGGNPNTDKVCSSCKLAKPKADFYRCSSGYDGLIEYCKLCFNARRRTSKRRRRVAAKSAIAS